MQNRCRADGPAHTPDATNTPAAYARRPRPILGSGPAAAWSQRTTRPFYTVEWRRLQAMHRKRNIGKRQLPKAIHHTQRESHHSGGRRRKTMASSGIPSAGIRAMKWIQRWSARSS